MSAVFEHTDAFAPEPVQSFSGIRLDIALCEYQYPGCNGAGGCAVMTPTELRRCCSRCGEVLHRSGIVGIVVEIADARTVTLAG